MSSSETPVPTPATKKRVSMVGCTTGLPGCYCLSGRTRAIMRLSPDGLEVVARFCSQADAAKKLGLNANTLCLALRMCGTGHATRMFRKDGAETSLPSPPAGTSSNGASNTSIRGEETTVGTEDGIVLCFQTSDGKPPPACLIVDYTCRRVTSTVASRNGRRNAARKRPRMHLRGAGQDGASNGDGQEKGDEGESNLPRKMLLPSAGLGDFGFTGHCPEQAFGNEHPVVTGVPTSPVRSTSVDGGSIDQVPESSSELRGGSEHDWSRTWGERHCVNHTTDQHCSLSVFLGSLGLGRHTSRLRRDQLTMGSLLAAAGEPDQLHSRWLAANLKELGLPTPDIELLLRALNAVINAQDAGQYEEAPIGFESSVTQNA